MDLEILFFANIHNFLEENDSEIKKTRPSSDLEAATMYKLKGQSLNMQTGQGFKYRELVRPAVRCSRPV